VGASVDATARCARCVISTIYPRGLVHSAQDGCPGLHVWYVLTAATEHIDSYLNGLLDVPGTTPSDDVTDTSERLQQEEAWTLSLLRRIGSSVNDLSGAA
jgi:hypothetical protein